MAATLEKKISAEALDRSIYVYNIAPTATEKDLTDFFSFCGPIEKVILESNPVDGNQHSGITFGDLNTAATALLLAGAILVGQPIAIMRFPGSDQPQESAAPSTTQASADPSVEAQANTSTSAAPAKPAVSVIADVLAKGYILGENAMQKAKEFDEKHNISLKFKVAAESAKNKALKIDEEYKISEKAHAASEAAAAQAKKIDEQYHISEKASHAAAAGAATATVLASKAMSVSAVSSTVGFFKRGVEAAQATVGEIKAETQRRIDEKEGTK
eukprot:TRINITY_DN719_c0_g3_i1.p1 TRINITY_DN719_c0_g3~~TRINITY_DN719_c0_g3_i1.p1  ORF type:complete len:272 (-),score=89.02 TRINITY_DN719_c0_g3_i1:197-1012(-)